MKEKIFNCYAIVDKELITRVAMKEYRMAGSDEEKDDFLRERASGDFAGARQFPLPHNFIYTDLLDDTMITGTTWGFFLHMLKTGEYMAVFEKGFEALGASMAPFVNVSVVRDGTFMSEEETRRRWPAPAAEMIYKK